MKDQHKNNFVIKAKKFRLNYQLSEDKLNDLLKDKELTYSSLERGTKTITLDLAEAIAGIYGLTYCEFKETTQEPPAEKDLPIATQRKIKEKEGEFKVGQKGTRNINENIIVVLSTYLAGGKFTNSEIIAKFPKELATHMEDRSIEWGKGSLKGLVLDTKKREISPVSKKLEKVYQLVAKITPERLKEAKEKVAKSDHNET